MALIILVVVKRCRSDAEFHDCIMISLTHICDPLRLYHSCFSLYQRKRLHPNNSQYFYCPCTLVAWHSFAYAGSTRPRLQLESESFSLLQPIRNNRSSNNNSHPFTSLLHCSRPTLSAFVLLARCTTSFTRGTFTPCPFSSGATRPSCRCPRHSNCETTRPWTRCCTASFSWLPSNLPFSPFPPPRPVRPFYRWRTWQCS